MYKKAFPTVGYIATRFGTLPLFQKSQKYFIDNKTMVLNWPGNLPDLNPVENLCAIIKRRLLEHDCSTMSKLIEVIISKWCRDDEIVKTYLKLIESMPKRISQSIKNKEGHISY